MIQLEPFRGTMERLEWTDKRPDERMTAIDDRFDRLFGETREQREEMRAGFKLVNGEIRVLRGELRSEIGGLRGEFNGLRGEFNGLRSEFNGLHAEMVELRRGLHADFVALQRHVLSIIAGTMIAVLGLLGAFVAAQF